jgi:DNA topoisomerase-1
MRSTNRNPAVPASALVPTVATRAPTSADEPATLDPVAAAKAASLRYVGDGLPGIARRHAGRGFAYRGPDGCPVRDAATLARIRALAVPPAWRDVWICPDPDGHVQAIGWDARGRKQYRYHARWREVRDRTKFEHVLAFGRALPRLRRRVDADLRRPGLPREKVLAAVVRLMEHTLARVGNVEYARRNGTHGLTTLRDRHVRVTGAEIVVDFRGKHGVRHHKVLTDPTLARIVRNCSDLPGEELFQYVDGEGAQKVVSSQDVNDYLRELTGLQVTAKDFRTWAATNLAVLAIATAGDVRATKRHVVRVVEQVAGALCNTPAVCRKSYIHPRVLAAWEDGSLCEVVAALRRGGREPSMRAIERAVLRMLSVDVTAPRGRGLRSPARARPATPARSGRPRGGARRATGSAARADRAGRARAASAAGRAARSAATGS